MVLILSLFMAAQVAAGGYARPELLVETDWLSSHIADPSVRIVDLRPRGYGEGHVPNAVWLDNNWIRNPKAPPDFLPTPAEFEALMSRLGVGPATRVVAYDERGGIYAARLWWILNLYGHSNVALLNGGWMKWTAEQRPTSTASPTVSAPPFKAGRRLVGHATASDVLAAINRPGVKLVDARTQGEIDGKDFRNIKRAGFIESSVPVYWEDTFDRTTQVFKPAAEITRLYRERGILPADERPLAPPSIIPTGGPTYDPPRIPAARQRARLLVALAPGRLGADSCQAGHGGVAERHCLPDWLAGHPERRQRG